MLALILSVGFVVDDAIVMLENIVRHREMGKGALEAALDGSKEVGFTIVAMTLSLAVVFLPVFFMPGVFGRLLHEFAVVTISAVMVSGLVSVTLTPMLCKRYLRSEHGKRHNWMYRKLEDIVDAWTRWYGVTLRWALRHRVLVMLFGVLILVGTAWEFWIDSERLPAGRRYLADFGFHRSQAGDLFRFDEGASGCRESHSHGRPQRDSILLQCEPLRTTTASITAERFCI